MLGDNTWQQLEGKWQLMWCFPGQQKVRTFLWLLLHNALLTNEQPVTRHMAPAPYCASCLTKLNLRILQNCVYSHAVWSNLVDDDFLNDFLIADNEEWSRTNLKSDKRNHNGNSWNVTFGVVR